MKHYLTIVITVVGLGACAMDEANDRHSDSDAVAVENTGVDIRPNIILIVADDLGYGDIGVNGSNIIATPNINALAEGGVNFSSGYVTAAVCAPSRAALMTGRHQQSFAYEYNPRARAEIGIPVELDTVADIVGAEGYTTSLIGKWHLGRTPEHYPTERGFDTFFGFVGGGNGFLRVPEDGLHLQDPVPGSNIGFKGIRGIERNGVPIKPDTDLTTMLSREAVKFVEAEADSDDPFFMILAHFAPHSPLQATHAQIEPYAHIEDPATRIYAAMVSAVDEGVGELVEALVRTGQRENTLIVFMSDNGCASYIGDGACSNAPYAGFKGTHFEGGVRVPMIANWPGVLEPGQTYDQPIVSYDWSVTAMALAGAKTYRQQLDGLNLMPFLTNPDAGSPRSRMHWRTLPNFAIRDGDWKLWMVERSDGTGMEPLLYNLGTDPGETLNLAEVHPEELNRLIAAFEEWSSTMPEPGFYSNRRSSFPMPNGMRLSVYN